MSFEVEGRQDLNHKTRKRMHRTCSSKTRYASLKAVTRQQNKMRDKSGYKVYPYQCLVCRGWHLTHSLNPTMYPHVDIVEV